MGIIDDLIAHPGVYLGIDRGADQRGASAAKIVVTPLPGGAGVSLDYETFNAEKVERVRGHAEHALLGRTHGGAAILVTGHLHADTVAVLRESEPGVFVMGNEPSAFPVALSISIPAAGGLRHAWSYGGPGGDPGARNPAERTLASSR